MVDYTISNNLAHFLRTHLKADVVTVLARAVDNGSSRSEQLVLSRVKRYDNPPVRLAQLQ